MENQFCVYMWHNLINDKCYIGISKNIKKRFIKYKSSINNPKRPIEYALSKYGFNNFTFDIIDDTAIDSWRKESFLWQETF